MQPSREQQLIEITQQFLVESHAEMSAHNVTLQTSLQHHLGIDSIGRAELFSRIEKNFNVQLPDQVMAEADTFADILAAINVAVPLGSNQEKTSTYSPKLAGNYVDPTHTKTLIEVLLLHALQSPERPHIFFQDEFGKEEIITYGQLLEMSQRVAQSILSWGLVPGETVAIMQPTNPGFFYTFFGVLMAGCVPVPIYPPLRPQQVQHYAKQEANILRNAEVRLLITFHEAENLSHLLRAFIPSLKAVLTVKNLLTTQTKAALFTAKKEDFALIQYTSGSTSAPKGVLLTHENLLANIRAYGKALQITSQDVAVSWAPLYHDLGLIGMWLGSLYHGIPLVLLSPITFLNRPERWLWAIHHHRGTISGGPNFAYELCVRKTSNELLTGLDLSSWRLAVNGAEAIQFKTLQRFTEKFSTYGFKWNVCFPVYGLAESTVCLTTPVPGSEPRIDFIERAAFEKEQRAVPVKEKDEKNCLAFVGCGKPIAGQKIRIVDENNKELPERKIGNLQFQGPSSMQGYYRNPEATQAIYHDGWWDTGDLAYQAEGDVFITGRKKDMLIKAGRNLYPPEIEELTGQVPGIRKGCVIAFGVTDAERGTEKLIVVAETMEKNLAQRKQLIADVTEKIMSGLDIAPDQVILVPPRTVPKTSSGKLQRSACKNNYLKGKLTSRGNPVWWQVTKLTTQSVLTLTKNFFTRTGKIIYSVYVAAVALLLLLPLWLLSWILPRDAFAWISKIIAYILCWAAGCPLTVTNKKFLPKENVIFAANHASYVDSIALIAILPIKTRIVGKEEIMNWIFIRRFMRKLEHIIVHREDITKSLADTEVIKTALKNKYPILIFPEGTFSYTAGLRPFKLGAFKIAAEMQLPICPIALSGTRYILRGGELLFKPQHIKITIAKPVLPNGTDWQAVTQLKDQVRSAIAAHCGEPLLDFITPVIIKNKI